jgi:molybdate transport system ATP-binding protein
MKNTPDEYIILRNCSVEDRFRAYLSGLTWTYRPGETWLVTGANGSGKESFIAALADESLFAPKGEGVFFSAFSGDTGCVSLESAASLIAEERRRDQSDYTDGVDVGRTAREYVGEVLGDRGDQIARMETLPEIALTGIAHILDRGLKFLSTGEIRRTLIARALLSRKRLLVLSEPFAGLDAASREILFAFFDAMAASAAAGGDSPRVILCADRYADVPGSVTSVLEFSGKAISFAGSRKDYEALLESRKSAAQEKTAKERAEFRAAARAFSREQGILRDKPEEDKPRTTQTARTGKRDDPIEKGISPPRPLVDMRGVNVGWGENRVLRDFTWRVDEGEHWFIRGPNGAGKTTLLELITGDNLQVFSNDVRLFGARRGSGETLWDIRRQLGIVSYRLHLEYRMVGGTSVEDTVVSGFHDSIGLYEPKTDLEKIAARKWLASAGFAGRENAPFSSLSYGEQRAALILRAVVKCPPLLILDEPCHALDEDARRMILDLLEIVAEEGGSTMLHVTHDPTEMLGFERRILELRPGEEPNYKILER